jgi:tetratricopeptide (TPR) repeat protein
MDPEQSSARSSSDRFVDEIELAISRLTEMPAVDALEDTVWGDVGKVADLLEVRDAYVYELAISRLVIEYPSLVELAEAFLLTDHEAEPDIRLMALAVVMIGNRRQRRSARGRRFAEAAFLDRQHELGRLAGLDAAKHPLFVHLLALCYIDGDIDELKKGLGLVREARSGLSRHAGSAHSFAHFVVRIASLDLVQAATMFDEAMAAVNEAIELNPNRGRFYHTRAKLHRLGGNHHSARKDLGLAIEKEDRRAFDCQQRISEYMTDLAVLDLMSTFERRIGELDDRLATTDDRISDLRTVVDKTKDASNEAQFRLIETIAFFAGVLALVQASVGLLQNRSLWEAFVILLTLTVILFGSMAVGATIVRRTR